MKFVIAIAAAALLPAAALAQSAPAAPAAPAAAPAATLDTPIEQLLANEKTKAIVDAAIPGLSTHPMLDQFKSLSLKALAPMSGGQLTDEMLKKVEDGLAGK